MLSDVVLVGCLHLGEVLENLQVLKWPILVLVPELDILEAFSLKLCFDSFGIIAKLNNMLKSAKRRHSKLLQTVFIHIGLVAVFNSSHDCKRGFSSRFQNSLSFFKLLDRVRYEHEVQIGDISVKRVISERKVKIISHRNMYEFALTLSKSDQTFNIHTFRQFLFLYNQLNVSFNFIDTSRLRYHLRG